jgi:phage replication-related protein YjqB (UPF0714/DUF867 family)
VGDGAGHGPFAELLAHAGVEEVLTLRSTFGFMAFHGGNLEEMTDVVAVEAARLAGASLYAVLQPPDLRWHLPSTLVTPDQSPRLRQFLEHVDVAVAVHGYGRDGFWTTLLLGGQHRELAAHVGSHLRTALPEYEVVAELDGIPPALRGVHGDNPVNRVRSGGVQLELPPRVRGLGPFWADHRANGGGHTPHTSALIAALAAAASSWDGVSVRD